MTMVQQENTALILPVVSICLPTVDELNSTRAFSDAFPEEKEMPWHSQWTVKVFHSLNVGICYSFTCKHLVKALDSDLAIYIK